MKSCEYYQELISRLTDGDLSSTERAELDDHLRACPDCQAMLDAVSDISNALQNDMAEPPSALVDSVMERIRADAAQAAPIPITAARKKRHTPWRRLAVAACLVVVIGSGALFALQSKGGFSGAAMTSDMAMPQEYSRSTDAGAVYESAEAEDEAVMEAPAGAAAVDDAAPAEPAEMPLPEPDARAVEEETVANDIAAALPAYGPDGGYLGVIEDTGVLDMLLADADPGPDGLPPVDWDIICTVEYGGVIYAFGTDSGEEYLVWWDVGGAGVSLSPGTVTQLESLITP